MKQIQSLYGNRIKFIFRHFPLSMHDKAYDAALATEAAGMQGRFWDMQNQLFTNQQAWASNPNYKQMWVEYAQKIGIDPAKFQSDMAGSVARQRVDLDIARARALNVSSTPTLYINGRAVPFQQVNVDPLRQIIDAELQSSAGRSSSTPAGAASPAPAATQGSTASSGSTDTNKTGGNSR
jgi:protein-disulfide isomerase